MTRLRTSPRPIDLGDRRPEEIAAAMAHLDGFVFLDSASSHAPMSEPPGQHGAISILAAGPRRVLRGHLDDAAELREALAAAASPRPQADRGIPLGGAFGFVRFDGRFTFGIYDNLLLYDHLDERWFEIGSLRPPPGPPPPLHGGARSPLRFSFATGRDAFCRSVTRAQEHIAAGDIYQVNLSHAASSPWSPAHDAFDLYRRLREVSPAPFAAFLNFDGQRVLSSSPELFLKISGDFARTRPIKGTRPRFSDADRDEKSAYDLITSPKEVAELVMITDLERNDLGRVCQYGSVRAAELLKLERFAQVFHLVSTVQGTLRPEVDHLEALRACFPGGSISGAPKKRALEIIEELEPSARGLYTGAIGYLGFNGESQFNIAIRTAVAERDRIHFHVGAGIVTDSIPEREYEETLHKAAGLLRAAEEYNAAHCRTPPSARPAPA